jgi:hypothetical protein
MNPSIFRSFATCRDRREDRATALGRNELTNRAWLRAAGGSFDGWKSVPCYGSRSDPAVVTW